MPAVACFPGGSFVSADENFLLYWCPMYILIAEVMVMEERKAKILINRAGGQRRGPFQRLPGGAALCLDEELGYHRERPGGAAAI